MKNNGTTIDLHAILVLCVLLAGWCGGVTVDGRHYDASCGCGGVKFTGPTPILDGRSR